MPDAGPTPLVLDVEALGALAEFSPDDPGFVRQLARTFRDDGCAKVAAVHAAVAAGDAAALRRVAHGFKGASWTVGAAELAAVCGEVEEAIALGRAVDVAAAGARIAAAFARVDAALAAWMEGR